MAIYIYIVSSILILALVFFLFEDNKFTRSIYLYLTFFQLLIISSIRSNVGKDYNNYRSIFNLVNRLSTFEQIYDFYKNTKIEFGYLLLNKLIGLFTDNFQSIFVLTSFIILILIFVTIKNYSEIQWFSIYLLAVGAYISSFNIQRQYVAVAIVFYSFKYIKEKKLLIFLITVLVASLFHISAIMTIPFYFFSSIRVNLKNMMILLLTASLSVILFDEILTIFQLFFYDDYKYSAYGYKIGNLNSFILSFIYFMTTMVFKRQLLKKNQSNMLLINWNIMNFFLSILSLRLWIITRLMAYTSIIYILLVPEIISSVNNKYLKTLITSLFLIITFITYFNSLRDPLNNLVPYQVNHGFYFLNTY